MLDCLPVKLSVASPTNKTAEVLDFANPQSC